MFTPFLKRFVQRAMMSSSPVSGQAEMNSAAVEDTDFTGLESDGRSPEERTASILSRMSLEEKLSYIGGYKSLGIHALPRHGLPSVWMSDATSGIRSYGATTAYPSAVALAASWNTGILTETADHIAEIARAKGISILLGPGVNIARIPTCGRNFEYMGEDPFLAGALATAYIRACKKRGVICTVKHLAANNSDYDRHKVSSDMDERTLREIYLPAFETAVIEGNTSAVMSSYNPVNGVWASENRKLLTDILRTEWGFDGFVISDWNSLYSTAGPLKAGLDLEMPAAKWLSAERVQEAFDAGEASESDIDRMAGNLMRTLFAAGVYDRPVQDANAREFCDSHEEAALKAALAGPVLLKNDDAALPLPEGRGVRILLCGPHTESSPTMGGGSCHIARTTGTVNLLEGMKSCAGEGTEILHLPWKSSGRLNRKERQLIRDSDAVVLACGFNYVDESELYDRAWKLPAPQRRLIQRVSSLNKRCTVVLTAGGGVETRSWIENVPALVHGMYLGQYVGKAAARLLFGRENFQGRLPFSMAKNWTDIAAASYYPRRYWTTSMGRIALGQGNPRLRKMRHWYYGEGLMVGYRHFDTAGIEPAFAFGHGLAYTRFALEDLKVSKARIPAGEDVEISLKVRNTGSRDGRETVQVYVAPAGSRLVRPEKELKGFAGIHLKAGETGTVRIPLPFKSFRCWDPQAPGEKSGDWVVDPGKYEILVGSSSRNIAFREEVIIT